MTKCGCYFWANQYAAGYSLCPWHSELLEMVATAQGITAQEAFDRALEEKLTSLGVDGGPSA